MPSKLARRVIKNVVYNTSTQIIAKLAGSVVTIALARILLPEDYGIYGLALSTAFLILTFSDAGINGTLARYVSEALGKKKVVLARTYFRFLLKFKILISGITSFALLLLSQPLAVQIFNKPDLAGPLQASAAFMFVYSLLGFFSSTFYATQSVKYVVISNAVYDILRTALSVLFVLLGFSATGALAGFAIASAFATLTAFVYFATKYKHLLFGPTIGVETKRLYPFLAFMTVAAISGSFFVYTDTVMLGLFVTADQIGHYRAAYAFVFAVGGILSVTNVLFPVFTQLEGKRLERAFQRVVRYSAILTIPAAIGLAKVAGPFVNLIYGPAYAAAALPLAILALLIFGDSIGSLYGYLFAAKEKPEYLTYVMAGAAGLNVVLNYFFILAWGILGAAAATLVARYLATVTLAGLSIPKFKIKPNISDLLKPLAATIPALAVLLLILALNIGMLIAEIALAIIVYFATLFVLRGFTTNDIKYLARAVR